jgi:hypothetical protein
LIFNKNQNEDLNNEDLNIARKIEQIKQTGNVVSSTLNFDKHLNDAVDKPLYHLILQSRKNEENKPFSESKIKYIKQIIPNQKVHSQLYELKISAIDDLRKAVLNDPCSNLNQDELLSLLDDSSKVE